MTRTPEPAPQDNAEIVERCARNADDLSADMDMEAKLEPDGMLSSLHEASAHTAAKIAAAIRALATPIQGEI